ncbi:MAG: flagellar assembly protein H [Parcubacteria group bacterium ADurb.Bin216]|nr:MAG: flagellar assembly protein H [Parcubacteria group bacterium ADurb.Bin216]
MNKSKFDYWYESNLSLEQRLKDQPLKELLKAVWEEAYIVGYEDGRAEGYNDGHEDGFVVGHDEGYEEGIRSVEEE